MDRDEERARTCQGAVAQIAGSGAQADESQDETQGAGDGGYPRSERPGRRRLGPGIKGGSGGDWWLGLACGTGGLIGGYLGARLQPRFPERALRLLLGTALGVLYAAQTLS
ncbi:hypothetical protein ACF05L_36880 [Streptomyces bobili]|uniref:hypothetical protein n=1 Tax=Streptomyces bobili TaxID=67280 RepID=UPI0036FE8F87